MYIIHHSPYSSTLFTIPLEKVNKTKICIPRAGFDFANMPISNLQKYMAKVMCDCHWFEGSTKHLGSVYQGGKIWLALKCVIEFINIS